MDMEEMYDDDILDTVIFKDGGGDGSLGMYSGFLSDLKPFDKDRLHWNVYSNYYVEGEDACFLTLGEIAEQLRNSSFMGILTIIVESPLYGEVYQMGNYASCPWKKIGTLKGYA